MKDKVGKIAHDKCGTLVSMIFSQLLNALVYLCPSCLLSDTAGLHPCTVSHLYGTFMLLLVSLLSLSMTFRCLSPSFQLLMTRNFYQRFVPAAFPNLSRYQRVPLLKLVTWNSLQVIIRELEGILKELLSDQVRPSSDG